MQSREQRELVCGGTEYPGDVGFLYFCSIRRFERDSLTLVLFFSIFCLFGFVVYVCGPTLFVGGKFLTVFLVRTGADMWVFMKHSFKIWLGVCISI
jgi:hypothetical protein